ncbi:SpoIID/LytB domain-containing protein [uncultured Gemmiger sp.]|uniref:SpoIID/LytB domain-containing protein n=1 Tax=uncultured Gemmiger sp. TaxID=1623490 RepID=UPI0025DF6945|nr:SpoIID/LytB domain-containing protein [uncultured Gemmiger sp.]
MKKSFGVVPLTLLLAFFLPFSVLLLPRPAAVVPAPEPLPEPTLPPLPTATPSATPADGTVTVWDAAVQQERTLPLQEFLVGLAACEMPPEWPAAALCAQMVAGYSYAMALGDAPLQVNSAQCLGWTDADVLKARWGDDYERFHALLVQAAQTVGSSVLTYDGSPAAACYHSISAGHTEASQNVWETALPYLQGVPSPADLAADGYETTVEYSPEQVSAVLTSLELEPGSDPAAWFGDAVRDDAGYITAQTVCDTAVSGTKMRRAFHLRSASFAVEYNGTSFCFTTHGYGHGVGLSQYGAKALAEQGRTWQEILLYYFPGCEIHPS